jgi:hypothetical protein
MRINNWKHFPWLVFVILATAAASVLYVGNFHPGRLPSWLQLPPSLIQEPTEHHTVGGTPLGLWFGAISLAIFIFAALLSLRKKIPLWRVGTVQRWLRAHIWLTLLTIPLILLHSGFRLGGPMTTLLMALYAIVMVSGIYGLFLQHLMPRLMKERLPAETVFEQIPHIRTQLAAAAGMRTLLYDPVDESGNDPYDATATGYMFRIYTQAEQSASQDARCALWLVDDEERLLYRTWPVLTPEDASNWTVVAEGVVNRTLDEPAFTLDSAGRTLGILASLLGRIEDRCFTILARQQPMASDLRFVAGQQSLGVAQFRNQRARFGFLRERHRILEIEYDRVRAAVDQRLRAAGRREVPPHGGPLSAPSSL